MSKLKRSISIVLLISLVIMLSGCYDAREIDDMAYAIALGIDKGKTNELKLTIQFASTKGGGMGGSEEGGDKGGNELVVTTLEAPSVFSGLNMMNSYISKQINMSHAKVIVFSEELAKEGIYKYISGFLRSREFRGNMYLAISRTSAEDYIRSAKPKVQANSARMFDAFFRTYQFTGFSTDSLLSDVYTDQLAMDIQAVASLVGVGNYKDSKEFDPKKSTYMDKGRVQALEGDFKAGDLPKTYEVNAELMGLGVFNGGKMVGELDGHEAMMYLMLTGKYKQSYLSLPDPENSDRFVVLSVKQSRMPENRVDISGNKPVLHSKVRLEADIIAIHSGFNYEIPQNTPILEAAAENMIKKEMLGFMNKITKEYNSDICGFGKEAKKKFLTYKDWDDYNWLSRYKDAEFTIDVDLKIRRPGLVVRTIEAESADGREFD